MNVVVEGNVVVLGITGVMIFYYRFYFFWFTIEIDDVDVVLLIDMIGLDGKLLVIIDKEIKFSKVFLFEFLYYCKVCF